MAVGRVKLATPPEDTALVRGNDGLFRTGDGDPLPNDEIARLLYGAIEGSNVNSVETMVGMIAAPANSRPRCACCRRQKPMTRRPANS